MSWTVYNSDGQILQGSSTLADDAVTTAKILNANVTLAKMAANSIDSTQYVDGSIDTAHIGNDQVTGAKLNPSLVLGDIIYADGTDTIARLAKGSENEVLTMGGSNAPTWAAASSGPSQANQAAVEAETNEDTYVPPDLLRDHPGVAKAWVMVTAAGAVQPPSYNVDSITDTGTGNRLTIFTTDFSTSGFHVHGLSDSNAGSIYAERTSVGTSRFYTLDNATTPNAQDRYSGMLYFGDQS